MFSKDLAFGESTMVLLSSLKVMSFTSFQFMASSTSFGMLTQHYECHNPSLKLATKARACEGIGQI
jgi:hypothetical protein